MRLDIAGLEADTVWCDINNRRVECAIVGVELRPGGWALRVRPLGDERVVEGEDLGVTWRVDRG